jgi:hypothetical protein
MFNAAALALQKGFITLTSELPMKLEATALLS